MYSIFLPAQEGRMQPIIKTYTLGQMGNNTYLFGDAESHQAVLIDPSFDTTKILPGLEQEGWQIEAILLTHAHFDHTNGIYELIDLLPELPPIALHPCDMNLYHEGGLGGFGLHQKPLPEPELQLHEGIELSIGAHRLSIHHCPGHTPGHVFFYSKEASAAFVGDIIFQRSVGRTDLPGGSEHVLLKNIHEKVMILPDETILLPGHGPATTVKEERLGNPFL